MTGFTVKEEEVYYLPSHDDQSDVGRGGLIECGTVRDVDTPRWCPFTNFPQLFSFQFEQIQFEIAALSFVKLYPASQSIDSYLRIKAIHVWNLIRNYKN